MKRQPLNRSRCISVLISRALSSDIQPSSRKKLGEISVSEDLSCDPRVNHWLEKV
jgi:hypothetical protein